MIEPQDVLRHYVQRHNQGVSSGDFDLLLEMFSDDATMEITGKRIGPFTGKPAIERAFAEHLPTDELVVLTSKFVPPGTIEAGYAWRRAAGTPAGSLRLEIVDASIARLVVSVNAAPDSL